MREIGSTLGLPLFVFGPETHMTAICGMALGKKPIQKNTDVHFATANFLLPGGQQQQEQSKMATSQSSQAESTGESGRIAFGFVFCCLRVRSKVSGQVHKLGHVLQEGRTYERNFCN